MQEDHPDVIGANVKEWLIELGVGWFQPKAETDIVGISSDASTENIGVASKDSIPLKNPGNRP